MVSAYQVASQAASAVRGGLIADTLPPAERTSARAYMRVATNVGFAVGTVFASLALTDDTQLTYRLLLACGGVAYLIAGLGVLRIPAVPGVAQKDRVSPLMAMRDGPYLTVTALSALLSMHYSILEVGMPLWIKFHTNAPTWMVTGLFILNTAMVTSIQVRASKYANTTETACRAVVISGLMLAAGCFLLMLTANLVYGLAVPLLIVAVAVYTFGEVLGAASSWTLGFNLAPDNAQGQYQGLFSSGAAAGQMLGPLVVTMLPIELGRAGWLALGMLLMTAATAVPFAVGWAERKKDIEIVLR